MLQHLAMWHQLLYQKAKVINISSGIARKPIQLLFFLKMHFLIITKLLTQQSKQGIIPRINSCETQTAVIARHGRPIENVLGCL